MVRWSWLTRQAESRRFTDVTAAALLVLTWHPNVWVRFTQGYPGDSIFTLSLFGRVGLIALTVLLVLLLITLSQLKSRWLQHAPRTWSGSGVTMMVFDVMLTTLLFIMALTLVPQLYYSYYQLLFEGLPQQWIVKPLPLASIWHSVRVPREASMALHTIGLCGWWLLIVVVLSWLRALRLANYGWWLMGVAVLANIAWHFLV